MNRFVSSCILLVLLAAVFAVGCRTVTNSRPGMQVMINSYFDEDGHEYPSLDDRIFAMKMRATSVLVPQKFVREVGFWFFTTEPHRDGRIPVLLVHGHWSGPPAFKALAASIDTERFEPWFTYYPSGLDLRELGVMFRINLARTAAYHGDDEVVIIAYSMGGLVTKEALKPSNDGVELPGIPLLIGIANPWDGSPKTNSGKVTAFTARPDRKLSYGPESWKQVYENAPYFRDLFRDPFPAETEFHMIYGLAGTEKDFSVPSDGMLTESSLGRPEAVALSKSVTIFNESDHESIISDAPVIEKVSEILNAFWSARHPSEQTEDTEQLEDSAPLPEDPAEEY